MAGGMQPNVGLGAGVAPTNNLVGAYKMPDVSENMRRATGVMGMGDLPPATTADQMSERWQMFAGDESIGSYKYGTLESERDLNMRRAGGFEPKFIGNPESGNIKAVGKYTQSEVDELKEEYKKQEEILAAQRQQFAELAAGSGTPQPRGAGSVNVGSRGPIQINPLNPVAQIKQPEILTGPFLGRWRR